MIQRVGIVSKDDEEAYRALGTIRSYLATKGVEVVVERETSQRLGLQGERTRRLSEMDVDLGLVLGGDGTLLKTASQISPPETPLYGINFGTMGFLMDGRPQEWKRSLDAILRGDFQIEERTKLEIRKNGEEIGNALNEAVVMTATPVRMLHIEVTIDGTVAEGMKADGVLVSTPTGSTAYSFSAGGPVMDPRVPAFLITPLCPFEERVRSLVVPQEVEIRIRLLREGRDAVIVVDGEERGRMSQRDEATLHLSRETARLVKLEKDFYGRIRERFQTGSQ
jgi:NAD+ kinase